MAEDMTAQFQAIMESYTTEVQDAVVEAVRKGGKFMLKEVKDRSPVHTGRYKKGWRLKVEIPSDGLGRASAIVYNKDKPGLTHLLEKGHQKKSGGRTVPIPHIAPAQAKAEQYFEQLVVDAIGGAGRG